ncbi:MAG TPA: N-acetylmuramoyl-L-alanine amidase [Dissulfurispiraceae bacterium]|nr:N-acetylmuramoyl-L-alanine amidase [Dissulfurispiraceae bacterium]
MIERGESREHPASRMQKHRLAGCSLFFVMILLFCAAFVFVASGEPFAADPVEVKGVRQWAGQNSIRIVIDLSDSATYLKRQLSNPERLFLDLKNAKLSSISPKTVQIGDRIVRSVRLGQFSADTVRIVFDLDVQKYDCRVVTLEDPTRLVIDFGQKGQFEQKPEPKIESVPEANPAPVKPQPRYESADVRRRIVIDAGHGGHDPGAVGKSGLYEKDVVLDIALQVKSVLLKQYPGYDVLLTREKDLFIPLDERAAIANRGKADLFVSIHANASTNRKARGIETYILNWTNDEESIRVAARENAISVRKMRQVQNEVTAMLASLERQSKRDESVKLAGYIQNSMISDVMQTYPQVNNLGVKQALFYVLVGAKMPSALVEVAFISNPEEESLLAKDAYRRRIASAVAAGIHSYFLSAPSQKVAGGARVNYASAATKPRAAKLAK